MKNQIQYLLINLLLKIGDAETNIQVLRQTLNQQLFFNLQDLFDAMTLEQYITVHDIQSFLQVHNESLRQPIESIIKFYNGNKSMKLKKQQFSKIFLSRQNKLLAKLVTSRKPHKKLSQNLQDYAKKIIVKEIEMHQQILSFKSNVRNNKIQVESYLKEYLKHDEQNAHKLQDIITSDQFTADSILQYFSLRDRQPLQNATNLLLEDNCEVIKEVLNKQKKKEPKKYKDPLIHQDFHKLLKQPKTTNKFSYREVKSIEKHMKRINSKRRLQISTKVNEYRKIIQKEIHQLSLALKQIIWYEKQCEYAKAQLKLCTDFHPSYFFPYFDLDKNKRIIPSSMQSYLQKFKIEVTIAEIYVFFRRYSNEVDNKLSFLEFSNLFQPVQRQYKSIKKNSRIKSLDDVSIETKKTYLTVLATLIKNQNIIQKIKQKLIVRDFFDLRNIFNCIDDDQDQYISILDINIIMKKYLELDLTKLDIMLLLNRFSKKDEDDFISYQEFILQLSPKTAPQFKNKSIT